MTTIRTIFAQPTGPLVHKQVEVVAAMLEPKLPEVAAMLRQAREREEITAFADFPGAHWPNIWSTNPLERLNREVKRRTEVVGNSPTPPPCAASPPASLLRPTTSGK